MLIGELFEQGRLSKHFQDLWQKKWGVKDLKMAFKKERRYKKIESKVFLIALPLLFVGLLLFLVAAVATVCELSDHLVFKGLFWGIGIVVVAVVSLLILAILAPSTTGEDPGKEILKDVELVFGKLSMQIDATDFLVTPGSSLLLLFRGIFVGCCKDVLRVESELKTEMALDQNSMACEELVQERDALKMRLREASDLLKNNLGLNMGEWGLYFNEARRQLAAAKTTTTQPTS